MSTTVIGFSASTNFHLSIALMFLFGVGQSWFGIMQSSIVLLRASDEMRSRAMGAVALAIGFGPVGKLTLGAMAEGMGAPLAVGLFGAAAVASVVGVATTMPVIWKAENGEVGMPSEDDIPIQRVAGPT